MRTLLANIALLFALLLGTSHHASAQIWTVLTADPKGDAANPALADAAQLSYRYAKEQDLLSFRVTLYGIPNPNAFGVNIVIDTGADESAKMDWWGANKSFRFDRLITAWVTRDSDGYQGTIGIADAAGVRNKQFQNLRQNNLELKIEDDSIIIIVKRSDITDRLKMKLIAAVGSNEQWNDDMPNTGFATLDLAAERPKQGLREIDLSRNNFESRPNYRTLSDEDSPAVTKIGKGKQAIILVPGMYSSTRSFAGFITENESRYTMYMIVPPGVCETAPRTLPDKGLRLGEQTWTRLLERDILNLIRREKLIRPVIVAERNPGSIAAIELALQHPSDIGGIILAGSGLPPFSASPKDSTRKTPATLAERIAAVEEGLAAKWFKYVTPETWLSNDYRPEWFSDDATMGQQAWQEMESAPLEVKIRYLCEFWASNARDDFENVQAPVLILVPGFDEAFLADPANNFPKTSFLDAWKTAKTKPNVEVVTIAGARLLTLQNKSEFANDAIARFIDRVRAAK